MASNLRNKPLDKRHLTRADRESLRGLGTSRRETALKRANQRRGSLAYQQNRPKNTTDAKPGSGGMNYGAGIQAARQKQEGINEARAESFRPEKFKEPEDPMWG